MDKKKRLEKIATFKYTLPDKKKYPNGHSEEKGKKLWKLMIEMKNTSFNLI